MVVCDRDDATAGVEAIDRALESRELEGAFDLGQNIGYARGSFVSAFGFVEDVLAPVLAHDEDFAGGKFHRARKAGLRPAGSKTGVRRAAGAVDTAEFERHGALVG